MPLPYSYFDEKQLAFASCFFFFVRFADACGVLFDTRINVISSA